MFPLRPLMQVLATLLVVVSCILPIAAPAHAGHRHSMAPSGAGAPCSGMHASAAAETSLDHREQDRDGPSESGHGCGCLACHIAAVPLDPVALATVDPTRADAALPDDVAGTGISPETFPKPPRSFA